MTTLKPELKPCPFCGSEPQLFKVSWHGWYVGCSKDNITCVCLKYVPTKEEAITAWNTRTPDLGKRILEEAEARKGWANNCWCISVETLKQIIAKVQG